ncbi:hypothetical protein QUH73_08070 [Labilibaculum sp. K2S]|nr:hypothetical protein [Labilibaculum sp. K2S]MDM8159764.1 hypothetical protein [Labilibaculum sp. K2S]
MIRSKSSDARHDPVPLKRLANPNETTKCSTTKVVILTNETS